MLWSLREESCNRFIDTIVRKTLLTPTIFRPLGIFIVTQRLPLNLSKPEKVNSKVLLIAGCVQPSLAPNINHSIKNVLSKLNIEGIESSQSAVLRCT